MDLKVLKKRVELHGLGVGNWRGFFCILRLARLLWAFRKATELSDLRLLQQSFLMIFTTKMPGPLRNCANFLAQSSSTVVWFEMLDTQRYMILVGSLYFGFQNHVWNDYSEAMPRSPGLPTVFLMPSLIGEKVEKTPMVFQGLHTYLLLVFFWSGAAFSQCWGLLCRSVWLVIEGNEQAGGDATATVTSWVAVYLWLCLVWPTQKYQNLVDWCIGELEIYGIYLWNW